MHDDALDIDPIQYQKWLHSGMEKNRYQYDLIPSDLIMDIGAYQGFWSKMMHEIYGCRAIMFEPVDILNEFKDTDWAIVVQAAAWIFDDKLNFGGNGYWTSHYIYGVQEYPCININKYLNQPIAVLKLNVEGAEYDILDHILKSGLQKNIKNFQIQFHNMEEYCINKRKEIQGELSKTHKQTWNVDFVWENWERC